MDRAAHTYNPLQRHLHSPSRNSKLPQVWLEDVDFVAAHTQLLSLFMGGMCGDGLNDCAGREVEIEPELMLELQPLFIASGSSGSTVTLNHLPESCCMLAALHLAPNSQQVCAMGLGEIYLCSLIVWVFLEQDF